VRTAATSCLPEKSRRKRNLLADAPESAYADGEGRVSHSFSAIGPYIPPTVRQTCPAPRFKLTPWKIEEIVAVLG
jgi:hypothetical protein